MATDRRAAVLDRFRPECPGCGASGQGVSKTTLGRWICGGCGICWRPGGGGPSAE